MPAPPPDTLDQHAEAISRLLDSIERPPSDVAVIAYKAALSRRGREIDREYGSSALIAMVERVRVDGPRDRLVRRETTLTGAWWGLLPEIGDAA